MCTDVQSGVYASVRSGVCITPDQNANDSERTAAGRRFGDAACRRPRRVRPTPSRSITRGDVRTPEADLHVTRRASQSDEDEEYALSHAPDERIRQKGENHADAVALHFMHYMFTRIHKSLRVTPAIEAGVVDHPWMIEEGRRTDS